MVIAPAYSLLLINIDIGLEVFPTRDQNPETIINW